MEVGTHTGMRTRCSYQNSAESCELQRTSVEWGGSHSQKVQRQDRLQRGAFERAGPSLCRGGDWELCACLRVFKKLTLPWNHLEIPWCLRHPDSLPNWSLEEMTKPDRMGALKGISESSCPTACQALDEEAFSATQVLTRNQAPKRKNSRSSGWSCAGELVYSTFFSVPLHFPSKVGLFNPKVGMALEGLVWKPLRVWTPYFLVSKPNAEKTKTLPGGLDHTSSDLWVTIFINFYRQVFHTLFYLLKSHWPSGRLSLATIRIHPVLFLCQDTGSYLSTLSYLHTELGARFHPHFIVEEFEFR